MSEAKGFSWWALAERAAGRLTVSSDVARSDARVEQVLATSVVFSAVGAFAAGFRRAWPSSATARVWDLATRDLARRSSIDRIRLGGLVTATGALTALALQRLEPMWASRFDAIVPAAAVVAGALACLLARPIARALADRRP